MVNHPGFFKCYIPSLGEENMMVLTRLVLIIQLLKRLSWSRRSDRCRLQMAKLGSEGIFGGSRVANMFPSHLVHYIRGTQPRHMTLRDRNNNLWHLKIEKHGDIWYFTNGWREFVKDNMIKKGDILAYEYASKSLLDVKIFASSGCEGGVEVFKIRNIKEVKPEDVVAADVRAEDVMAADDEAEGVEAAVEAEHEEAATDEAWSADDESEDLEAAADDEAADGQLMDDGTSVPVHRRKRRKNIDFYGSDLFISGRIRQPTNPYFVTEMRDTRLNELYVPRDIVKGRNIQLPDHMMIVDSEGRKYPTRCRRWKDGRTVYVGGWKSVCKVNLAGKDDKIVCEFVPSDTGALQLSVTFLPPESR